jgi:hypothetical protein
MRRRYVSATASRSSSTTTRPRTSPWHTGWVAAPDPGLSADERPRSRPSRSASRCSAAKASPSSRECGTHLRAGAGSGRTRGGWTRYPAPYDCCPRWLLRGLRRPDHAVAGADSGPTRGQSSRCAALATNQQPHRRGGAHLPGRELTRGARGPSGRPKAKSSKRAPVQKTAAGEASLKAVPLQRDRHNDEIALVRRHLDREGKLARGYGADGKPR